MLENEKFCQRVNDSLYNSNVVIRKYNQLEQYMWSKKELEEIYGNINIIPIEEMLKKAPPLLVERRNLFASILLQNNREKK